MSKKKKEEKEPILYIRYKRLHQNAEQQPSIGPPVQKEKIKKSRGLYGIVANIILTGILIGLIFLATIGTITLLNEDMRLILESILKQHIL